VSINKQVPGVGRGPRLPGPSSGLRLTVRLQGDLIAEWPYSVRWPQGSVHCWIEEEGEHLNAQEVNTSSRVWTNPHHLRDNALRTGPLDKAETQAGPWIPLYVCNPLNLHNFFDTQKDLLPIQRCRLLGTILAI